MSIGLVAAALATGPARAAEPFTIDVVLPLTGSASFLGKGEQTTLELLQKQVNAEGGLNGRPLAFNIVDDESSPQVAVQVTRKIAAAKPAVVLGSALVSSCNAMAPLMKSGPGMYFFSAGMHPAPGSFAFSSYVSTDDLYRVLLTYFRDRGWNKIGMITSTDATGQDATKGIHTAMAEISGGQLQIVQEVSFNPSNLTVAAEVERVRGAAPDVVIVWTTGSALGNVLRAMSDLGMKLPVATTTANMAFAQMQQFHDMLPVPFLFPASEWPPHDASITLPPAVVAKQVQFFETFADAGLRPDGPATYAWDPAMIVIDALRKCGLDATAERLRGCIANLRDYAGINGIYDFTSTPQRGLNVTDSVMTRWSPASDNWTIISQPGGTPVAAKQP